MKVGDSMFCTKCGTKLEENSKFCHNCGQTTNVTPKKNERHKSGGIRKAIKKDAISRNKKTLILATLLILGGSLVFSFIVQTYYTISSLKTLATIIDILLTIVTSFVGFGLIGSAIEVSRGNEITLYNVFAKPFKNIKNILLYYLLIVLVIVGYSILLFIPFINIIVIMSSIIAIPVLLIYFYPVLDILIYLIMDEDQEKLPFLETLKKANKIVNGHRVEYYGMIFSFIGWFILGILTLGILYIWLIPYVTISMANMYRTWINETKFEATETGMTNGTVIGLTAGGYAIFIFMAFIAGIMYALINEIEIENYEDPYVYTYNEYTTT